MKRPIEPGKNWSCNYIEPGEYVFEVRGLDSPSILTIQVSDTTNE